MDENPTVQMDGRSDHERARSGSDSPPTIPIDDLFQEPDWPLPGDEPAPPRFAPPPPPPPPPPNRQGVPSGETVIMRPEASPPVLGWLALIDGPGGSRGTLFTLERETMIGRSAGQITLPGDAYVSSQHAKVRLEASDAEDDRETFVLYDLASANGTFAGDKEHYRDQRVYRHELKDGDRILVGETTLVFKQVALGDEA